MEIWTEPDQDDAESWVSLTGDDLAVTESPTWKVEVFVQTQTAD